MKKIYSIFNQQEWDNFFIINESKLESYGKINYDMFLKIKNYVLKSGEKVVINFDKENNLIITKVIKIEHNLSFRSHPRRGACCHSGISNGGSPYDYLEFYYFESSMNGYLHSFNDTPAKEEIRDDYRYCNTEWYSNGLLHRDNKRAAVQSYERIEDEEWLSSKYYESGKLILF